MIDQPPESLVCGCNDPISIGILSDWIEEQYGIALDLDRSGWSNYNGNRYDSGYGYCSGSGYGYHNGCGNGYGYSNGHGNGVGYGNRINGYGYGYGNGDGNGFGYGH